jgi:hypothetical protein
MRTEKEIKKLRANLLNQIDELEIFMSRKVEIFINIQAPMNSIQLPLEIHRLRDEIKFLRKEINVREGQIKLLDWVLLTNEKNKFTLHNEQR